MQNNDLTLALHWNFLKDGKRRKQLKKNSEICHDCTSASAISEFFALALTSLKKSCARAQHLTSARSERRSNERRTPKLCSKAITWISFKNGPAYHQGLLAICATVWFNFSCYLHNSEVIWIQFISHHCVIEKSFFCCNLCWFKVWKRKDCRQTSGVTALTCVESQCFAALDGRQVRC